MTTIRPDDLAVLSRLMSENGWTSLRLRIGSVEVELGDHRPDRSTQRSPAPVLAPATAPALAEEAPAVAGPTATSTVVRATAIEVTAPNLGTFYRSPTPGAPPYVEVGQHVEADDEICLIEVMKLYTPVKAGVTGTVAEICVADGDMVEYGQVLAIIEPNEPA